MGEIAIEQVFSLGHFFEFDAHSRGAGGSIAAAAGFGHGAPFDSSSGMEIADVGQIDSDVDSRSAFNDRKRLEKETLFAQVGHRSEQGDGFLFNPALTIRAEAAIPSTFRFCCHVLKSSLFPHSDTIYILLYCKCAIKAKNRLKDVCFWWVTEILRFLF
jgi:hypothetical protein